jgi:hypothetical protein
MNQDLKEEKEEEIFKVFLAHWINHIGEHAEGYQEWADKLKGTSKDDVSQEIYLAIKKMKEVQEMLLKAKICF